MNLFYKFFYAGKRIKGSKKMGVFSIVVMAAGLVMLYSSVILFEGLSYGEKAVKNSLSVPMKYCGILQFQDDFDVDGATGFMRKIYALDEIKSVGNYACYGIGELKAEGDTDYWNQMLDIQRSGELEFENEDGSESYVQAVLMNSELFDMQKIDLIMDRKLQEKSKKYCMLLGYNLRKIPVGTTFQDDYNKYEVMGIMKKGTYITDPDIISKNLGGLNMSYKINMDNLILVLIPEGEQAMGVRNAFCVNDGYTYRDAVSAIKEAGNEQGIRVKTGTLQARLDTLFSENKRVKSRIDIIAVIICIAVFMLCVTVQLLGIYMKRNEIGIWLANGMSRKEVFEIIWLENFIKVVIGGGIAVVLEGILLRLLFSNHKPVVREIVSMMYGIPLLGLVIYGFLLICVISVIPIMVIAKRQTIELVKGVWN